MKKTSKSRLGILFLLSASMFIVLFVTITAFSSVMILLAENGSFENINPIARTMRILISAVGALIFGTLISLALIRIPLKPVRRIINGMQRLADGHYDERIPPEKGLMGSFSIFREIGESFNALASELQNTEMLRSDFINNFSHEFKTPIVSISGFARILRRGDIPEEDRQEYLDIIVDESARLSTMATNVLNLTKVENQTSITDAERYNLSEQLRRCILMLEKKWAARQLRVTADFDEYMITGDMNLLSHVWLNLIDNAVKYSFEGGELRVDIRPEDGFMCVSVTNHGPEIPPGDMARLYDKFWQGDTSHASEGSGIGLSLVRRITQLHNGHVSVESHDGVTVFTVRLPAGN